MLRRWPARGGPPERAARFLSEGDVPEALELCAVDPVAATLAASRLEVARSRGLGEAGGVVWGFPAIGPLEGVCWAGANIVPVLHPLMSEPRRAEAAAAFARLAFQYGRRSSSVVGEAGAVLALWRILAERWPPAREVRANQPSMVIDRPPDVEPDPFVRLSVLSELPLLLPACVSMFIEEVGYSPVEGNPTFYTNRVRSLIAGKRSFRRIEGDPPQVLFKAELGAVTEAVAQVQGVWVDRAFRGRRLSEGGMAAVVAQTLGAVAPTVSLYVNDYNTPAIAAYRRVGFRQVGTYATVLF